MIDTRLTKPITQDYINNNINFYNYHKVLDELLYNSINDFIFIQENDKNKEIINTIKKDLLNYDLTSLLSLNIEKYVLNNEFIKIINYRFYNIIYYFLYEQKLNNYSYNYFKPYPTTENIYKNCLEFYKKDFLNMLCVYLNDLIRSEYFNFNICSEYEENLNMLCTYILSAYELNHYQELDFYSDFDMSLEELYNNIFEKTEWLFIYKSYNDFYNDFIKNIINPMLEYYQDFLNENLED